MCIIIIIIIIIIRLVIFIIIPNYYEDRIRYRISYNHKIWHQRHVYDIGRTHNISYAINTYVRGLCR